MPNPSPRTQAFRDWGPAVAVITAILSAVLFIGGTMQQVKQSAADISEIKREREGDRDKLNTIDVRTARIDATLQTLVPPDRRSAPQ